VRRPPPPRDGDCARRGAAPSSAVDLGTTVGTLRLPNPVLTAAGTAGHGAELGAFFDLADLGAVVVKSLSAEPWAGNPPPRVLPVEAGMLNSVGLQNPGIDAWLAHDLPALAGAGARVVVSVWGTSVEAYREVGRRLAAAAVPAAARGAAAARPAAASSTAVSGSVAAIVAVEANISCPNVEDRRRMFAHSCAGAAGALRALREGLEGTAWPVWAKLSPNVTDLPEIAAAALEAGAEGLTLVNTLMGLALDPATGRPRLGNGGGGLSGPALHPVAVRAVYECRAALPDAPIIGVGGVVRGEHAAELLAAGANAVQVGTATFADPRAPRRVLSELAEWCAAHGVNRLSDLIGRAHGPARR
jgi:dihydroorotate dehydrogenase (NAD+) catalytic subunit